MRRKDSTQLVSKLTESAAWRALVSHRSEQQCFDLRAAFDVDADRCTNFSFKAAGLFLDYSKNLITEQTIQLLLNLARQQDLEGWRQKMFDGEPINTTEQRAVLHTALRRQSSIPLNTAGKNVMPEILAVLDRMKNFCRDIHSGQWTGYAGKPIKDVVSIGIGGSYLGPKMVTDALKAYAVPALKVHFVSSLDPADIEETLANCDPATTLFIISSKTFTTNETMLNAAAAKDWFMQQTGSNGQIQKHFVAVSTNIGEAVEFGINEDFIFEFWDWVGGRYSLWSAIGLPIALAIGMDHFQALLAGASAMDEHFSQAPLESNMPVILALLGVWYNNFYAAHTHVILPYNQRLRFFPEYLQQQDMESNGKSVDREGNRVDYATGPVIWGSLGTNAQHAYYQLIHQGTSIIPSDLILAVNRDSKNAAHHTALAANFIAQSEALMRGKNEQEVVMAYSASEPDSIIPHKIFTGSRPSNTLILDDLSPGTLGALFALYEHKVFVQGVIWNINSFDQWGVELGKQLGKVIQAELSAVDNGQQPLSHDCSTNTQIEYLKFRYNNFTV